MKTKTRIARDLKMRLKKLYLTITIGLVILLSSLFSSSLLIVAGQGGVVGENNATIWVDNLGVAIVRVSGLIEGAEVFPSIGSYLYTLNVTPSTIDVAVENNSLVLVSTIDASSPFIFYYVSQLAYPNDGIWCLNYTSNIGTQLILPEGAVPFEISPIPLDVSLLNDNRLAYSFEPGNIRLCYGFPSEVTGATTSPQPPSSATKTTTRTATPPSTSGLVSPSGEKITKYAVFLLAIISGVFVGVLLNRLRSKGRRGGGEDVTVYLDERDRTIVEVLKERGPMTPRDLLKQLDMPRSAFYRRINRLKREGIIDQFEVGGKTYYRLSEELSRDSVR